MSTYEIWDMVTGNYLETCESKGEMEEAIEAYVDNGFDRDDIGVREIQDGEES